MDDVHDVETVGDSPEARFGAVLRRVRVQAGVSVRRLAKDLDRAHSTISDFENGRRLAGVEVVEQYEDYFGLPRGTLGAQRERARAQRLEAPRDATVDENLGDVVCPYMGLRAYEYDDAALFFGREIQVRDVLARLEETRFVAVLGASGSGKSSFVRAGLLAHISMAATNGGPSARVVLLTPGERPLAALATALNTASGRSTPVASDDLRADPDRLRRAARNAGEGAVVIVVDQLEELFTLCADETERCCFVEALVGAWREPSSLVVVIVALRADFYGRVAAYPGLAAAVVAHQTLIGPMNSAELRRAIELPAADCGLLLQPGLADTMLEDLGDEPGALPLLSHALLETWKRRRRLMLSVGGYREAGGVRGAIAQTAERILQSLPDADQQIARSIFLSLTDIGESAEPTRRRVDRADLAVRVDPAQRDRVLGLLTNARLLTLDEDTVTVAHEALIRHWPRLRGWIDADRAGLLTHRRLTDAAREWDTLHREPAALLRGVRLATASEWAADQVGDLSELEQDFLTTSQDFEQDELEAAKHRTRRLRILAGGLAALTVIVAVLAVWALDQRSDAQRQRVDAQREASAATSLALATSSASLRSSRPDIALLLALEANRASPRAEAKGSAIGALIAARDPGVLASLHGHANAVRRVAFSPTGNVLASTSADNTIRLWNTRTHRHIGAPLQGHTNDVLSVAFSPNGRTLVSTSFDRTIRLWDVHSHKEFGTLTGHGSIDRVAVGEGETLASVDRSGETIRLRDARTRKTLGTLTTHAHRREHRPDRVSFISSVAFGGDGHTLAAVINDTIRLWDIRTRKTLGTLTAPGHISRVAFGGDGHTLLTITNDESVEPARGRSRGRSAATHPFGRITLWDTRTRKTLATLTDHNGYIGSASLSSDGRTLASSRMTSLASGHGVGSADDRTIRLWDIYTHKHLDTLTGHTSSVSDVAFGSDGRLLATASDDQTIRLWDVHTRKAPGAPMLGYASTVGLALGDDGQTLASSRRNMIKFWNIHTRKLFGAPLNAHTSFVDSVTSTPDGSMLASGGRDGTIRLWDLRKRKQLRGPLTGHTKPVLGMAFGDDGHMLASSSSDGTIRLWDVRKRKPLGAPLTSHTGGLWDVTVTNDGRMLGSVSLEGVAQLWDLRTRKPRTLTTPVGGISSLAFSPDGHTLAASDRDGTIRLWNARTRQQLKAPTTDRIAGVSAVVFSPDGRTLTSTSDDGTVRLWDLHSRKLLAKLTGHRGPVWKVAFSSDGRTLASLGNDLKIRVWHKILWRGFAELQTEVCNVVGNGLSKTEWTQYVPGIPYRQSCP